mmetsp:Transcript_10769/g.19515  ORF Transcript_10769/g.19515 Transcript_10769/m.19515 type:complete len:81 (+) Transcript_10769:947-1189(+)
MSHHHASSVADVLDSVSQQREQHAKYEDMSIENGTELKHDCPSIIGRIVRPPCVFTIPVSFNTVGCGRYYHQEPWKHTYD